MLIAGKSDPLSAQLVSAEYNYAINSPGVAMVQTVFSATVYVNKVEINQRRFNQLVDSVKKLDTTDNMITAERKLDIVVKHYIIILFVSFPEPRST